MSGAPRRWIRLDADWEESPWLHALEGDAAGCWPRLLCWVKLRGKGGRCRWPTPAVLAHTWRVPEPVVGRLLAGALDDGAVVREENELLVTNWDTYQEPDRTAADRKRRQREKEEMSRRDNRDTHRDPSLSMSTSGVGVAVKEGVQGEDPAIWMHELWQEVLGAGRVVKLTASRRAKYRAMHEEQLRDTPDPRTAWRAVLWAVTQSEHHMSQRDYQMPESILRNEERRDKWVERAMHAARAVNQRDERVADMAEFIRRRRGA